MPVDSVYQQLIITPRVCERDISVFTVIPPTRETPNLQAAAKELYFSTSVHYHVY
jgi:hypothetical protein